MPCSRGPDKVKSVNRHSTTPYLHLKLATEAGGRVTPIKPGSRTCCPQTHRGGGHCRWPVTQVAGDVFPPASPWTCTVAGESAGSSVAFISSFFSLAMGRPVIQKVPCGTVPRNSLVARKSLVASYQESPLRHESPSWH